jgi:hypothetical protein
LHLIKSIEYVMGPHEVAAVFNNRPEKKLLIFTTRVRRKDGRPITWQDSLRFFIQSICRKIPKPLKSFPDFIRSQVFAYPLPNPLYWIAFVLSPLRITTASSSFLPSSFSHGTSFTAHTDQCRGSNRLFADDAKSIFMDGSLELRCRWLSEKMFDLEGSREWAKAEKQSFFPVIRVGNSGRLVLDYLVE